MERKTANRMRWAGVVVLLAAFGLRAYNLGGPSLWFDEAVTAINSAHPFAEMIARSRGNATTPIVLPTLWWLFGGTAQNAYTVRFLPLMFGVLAVAAALRLPKVGVARSAAVITAVWLACSPVQIEYAQEAREYSLSVLGALLLLYGLLGARRAPHRFPYVLGVAVVMAPHLSYGLLFGAAVALGMYAVDSPATRRVVVSRLLALGIGFTLSALASYVLLARDQMAFMKSGGYNTYLASYFPAGGAYQSLRWLVREGIDYVAYALGGQVSALISAAAIAVYVIRQLRGWVASRGRMDVIPWAVIALAAVTIAAAFLRLYPFGGIRQNLFAAPWVICATACAFVDAAGRLRARDVRMPYVALFGGCALLIGISFVRGIRGSYLATQQDIQGALAAIGSDVPDSSVYIDLWAQPAASFHFPRRNFQFILERDKDRVVQQMSSATECRFYVVATHQRGRYESIADKLRRRRVTMNSIFDARGAVVYEVDRCRS